MAYSQHIHRVISNVHWVLATFKCVDTGLTPQVMGSGKNQFLPLLSILEWQESILATVFGSGKYSLETGLIPKVNGNGKNQLEPESVLATFKFLGVARIGSCHFQVS